MYAQRSEDVAYICSVRPKEASELNGPNVNSEPTAIGLFKVLAQRSTICVVRANVICRGYSRTPLVDKQLPEHAKGLGISTTGVIKNVMLKGNVGGEVATAENVADDVPHFEKFPPNARKGQSVLLSHGWLME